MIYGLGLTDSGMTFDFGQYVADHEAIRLLKPITKGIEVNAKTLCVDLMEKVGVGGEYISARHTCKHMRSFPQSKLQVRDSRKTWLDKGGVSMVAGGNALAKEILAKHVPTPLPEEQSTAIRAIVEAFDASVI